jgi:hypothetical protein
MRKIKEILRLHFEQKLETMEQNSDYAEAKGLIQQARGVLESAFD